MGLDTPWEMRIPWGESQWESPSHGKDKATHGEVYPSHGSEGSPMGSASFPMGKTCIPMGLSDTVPMGTMGILPWVMHPSQSYPGAGAICRPGPAAQRAARFASGRL